MKNYINSEAAILNSLLLLYEVHWILGIQNAVIYELTSAM